MSDARRHNDLARINARCINFTPAWYLGLRGGYFRASDNSTDYCNTIRENLGIDSGRRSGRNSWYAGVGTGWNVTDNFGVGVHYDYFRAKAGRLRDTGTGAEIQGPKRSTALLGLTAEYTFQHCSPAAPSAGSRAVGVREGARGCGRSAASPRTGERLTTAGRCITL